MTQLASKSETLTDQLDREKRAVSYDVYDMTVRQLVDMATGTEIEVAPEYQRHFIWDIERESELIESIYLGIPVPSLYMAANRDGTWEVVDGVQRLSTLVHFCAPDEFLSQIGKKKPLVLKDLKKLTQLNNQSFGQLPKPVQLSFLLRPIRVTTLNDKSDAGVRYDLFERLNTGGVALHPQEIRNCVFRGKLRDLLKDLAGDAFFKKVVRLADNEQQTAMYEECILRFFAFLEGYKTFDHSVIDFLNDYMLSKTKKGVDPEFVALFRKTMQWVSAELSSGVARGNRSITPVNLFEAVAVGTGLAFQSKQTLPSGRLVQAMNSEDVKRYTTAATNNKRSVVGRIEFVRDALLK